MKTSILILISLFASLKVSAREIRVIYFQGEHDAPREAFLYGSSGNFVKIKLPRYNSSDAFELPDNGEQFIFLPQQLPPETPPPSDAPVVNIPLNWKLTFLLVMTDPDNSVLPIKTQPINASATVFAPGEIYWINLTEITVGGKVGEANLLVKPRSVKVTSSPKTESGDFPVLIDCVASGTTDRRWLLRQTWRHNPTVRQVVFIQPLDAPRIASLYTISF